MQHYTSGKFDNHINNLQDHPLIDLQHQRNAARRSSDVVKMAIYSFSFQDNKPQL